MKINLMKTMPKPSTNFNISKSHWG